MMPRTAPWNALDWRREAASDAAPFLGRRPDRGRTFRRRRAEGILNLLPIGPWNALDWPPRNTIFAVKLNRRKLSKPARRLAFAFDQANELVLNAADRAVDKRSLVASTSDRAAAEAARAAQFIRDQFRARWTMRLIERSSVRG